MESKKFNVGDRVRYTNANGFETVATGSIGTVVKTPSSISTRVRFDGISSKQEDLAFVIRLENLEMDAIPVAEPSTSKLTNPKDAIGSTKLGMSFVPDTLKVYAALAFTEGATKYGSYNWRVAGVRASIYKSAAERHLAKYWNGEWADPVTGVPHLASVIACAAIILDANVAGKLTDDRPPAINLSSIIDGLEPAVKHLMDLHKDKTPHHHTELDKQ